MVFQNNLNNINTKILEIFCEYFQKYFIFLAYKFERLKQYSNFHVNFKLKKYKMWRFKIKNYN